MRIKRLLSNIFAKPIKNYEYKGVKGYKVFNSDWTCKGFKYEIKKTYKYEGEIEVCEKGFHFCKKLSDCFSYYRFDPDNKVAEVEALGIVKTNDNKSVTNEIRIVRELNWNEVLDIVNQGKGNTVIDNTGNDNSGHSNAGDYNRGDCNTGDYNGGYGNVGYGNVGDYNSGHYNIGNFNSGHYNIGDYNSGRYNIGYCNTGHYNRGDWNSGDWNEGDFNTGIFNTITPKMYIFNKPSEWTMEDWMQSEAKNILEQKSELVKWICKYDMTDEEKEENPDYETTGGYLKVFNYEEMCINMWSNLTDREKEIIRELPNFDKDIFEEITGIKL